jgi:hypothetical protein
MPPLTEHLLAIDAEIIVKHSHRAVGIDRKMQGLVHQEVIPRTLADNPEVVYERKVELAILEGGFKALLGDAGSLVLGTRGLAGAAYTLRLEVEIAANVVAIDGERDQSMQGTAQVHYLPGTASSAGDENSQIDVRPIIDLYRCVTRSGKNREHCSETNRYYSHLGSSF